MGRLTTVLLCTALATSCTEGDDRLDMENVLELRVSPGHPPLSEALGGSPGGAVDASGRPRAGGAKPRAAVTTPSPGSTSPGPTTQNPPPARNAPAPTPGPDPEILVKPAEPPAAIEEPRPAEPKVEAFRTVTLAAGQTLYGLCQKHLGRGNAWREVARLNGWSEAQVSRLPEGQVVKLPRR